MNFSLLFCQNYCRVKAWNYNTPKASHFYTTKALHFYTTEVSYFYTAKVSFLVVLQPCYLHNKKPEVWEMNFTAIERKITQPKGYVPTFTYVLLHNKSTLLVIRFMFGIFRGICPS
jgi:hypothetical protein